MSRGHRSHPLPGSRPPRRRRRWLLRGTAALVVLALVAAGAAYLLDYPRPWFAPDPPPSPVTEPARVLPPAGLRLPDVRAAAAVAAPTADRAVSGSAVRRALSGLLRSKKLGRHVVVEVAQLSTGAVVYRHGTGAVTPASTMKLLTTTAALQAVGPEHRFTTRVTAPRRATGRPEQIVLVGGGDPFLARVPAPVGTYPARADLATLASSTARALRAAGHGRVRLGYDASLFSGSGVDPSWEPTYVPEGVVSPVSALWVDEGRERAGFAARSADPALAAAQAFATALAKRGVTVVGTPRDTRSTPGRRTLAEVRSAPLAQIVQHVLEVSDNEGAEVIARQVAVATGRPGSFAGATKAVRAVLAGIGITTRGDRIYDGSGLSRGDRLRAGTLLSVLRTAASEDHPALRAAVANLPVAGFTGSLTYRFDKGSPLALGTVRAKTGTLTGVHALAGVATSRDGAVMLFVADADRVKPVDSVDAGVQVDRIAAALGGCTCRRSPRATP